MTAVENPVRTAGEAIRYCYEQGWTDGLPVVPATQDDVEAFLTTVDRDPGEIIGVQEHLRRRVTVAQAAVNAIMAGCEPEYFPVVLAAWEALANEPASSGGAWQSTSGPAPLRLVENAIVGPLIAVGSFVCSIGNIPLASLLWSSGISFGGVISFIYADLIVLPILDIYRKYYGWKMSAFILMTFYVAMAAAALVVEFLFQILGLVPSQRSAQVVEASISFNYTTVLNLIFLVLATLLLVRFFMTGGLKMLRKMNVSGRV